MFKKNTRSVSQHTLFYSYYSLICTSAPQLMRLKKFLNEVLVDQLPPLRDLQRYLEELALYDPPPPTDTVTVSGNVADFFTPASS